MIDIRQVVAQIVQAKDASDKAAFTNHVHSLVRDYGQNLLLSLAQAITPSNPAEEQIVAWLKDQLVAQAKQIPGPAPTPKGGST